MRSMVIRHSELLLAAPGEKECRSITGHVAGPRWFAQGFT